jgi:hypothetical protein
MTPIEQDVLTLKNNIGSVDQLADLDRGLLDHTIQQLKERDARLEAAGVDNPRLLAGNTLKNLQNIRERLLLISLRSCSPLTSLPVSHSYFEQP